VNDALGSSATDPATGAKPATSLATRAKQLASRARAKTEDEKATQEHSQTETALTKLNGELTKFARVARTHRALKAAGVPVADHPDLDKPLKALRSRVDEVGRPASQFLNARTKDVTTTTAAMITQDGQAWQSWAQAEIHKLPLALVPRVSFSQRGITQQRIKELRSMAANAPSFAEVKVFEQKLDRVREELEHVECSDVDDVLSRFVNGRIRLAELTDEELAMLREDESLSQQLYLYLS